MGEEIVEWGSGKEVSGVGASEDNFADITHVPEVRRNHRVDEPDTSTSSEDYDYDEGLCGNGDKKYNLR